MYGGADYSADVAFRSPDNVAYDLAVLKVRDPHPFTEQLEMLSDSPVKGLFHSFSNQWRQSRALAVMCTGPASQGFNFILVLIL